MTQTPVEWLFEKLWDEPKDKFTWYTIREKAIQMEKEQNNKTINMDKKQTAVSWLVNEIFAGKTEAWQKEINQALQMEKEQIEISDEEILKAAKECVYEDLDISVGSFELGARWYREQLKKKQ